MIVEAGGRVRYTTAANLVNELAKAAGDKRLGRTIKKYGRVELLRLVELGYVKLDRHGAELLFSIFTERAITSNLLATEWDQTFIDKRLPGHRRPVRGRHHRDRHPVVPPRQHHRQAAGCRPDLAADRTIDGRAPGEPFLVRCRSCEVRVRQVKGDRASGGWGSWFSVFAREPLR
ncbi:ATP-binding protein [Streptomyces sp. NPDC088748]|uniref:ATP-binding protein n=1 Tax=Streptomyces sp. NPDC088748 TaxID=3365887 RepID=UPI0038181F71